MEHLSEDISIGVISEGQTDYTILKYLLSFYFQTNELNIAPLQPNPKIPQVAGWDQVLKYVASNRFRDAFSTNDQYFLIQIDTDVSEEYGVQKSDENGEFTVEKVIELVIERIKQSFHPAVLENITEYEPRILFCITVHSIECWLLPFWDDKYLVNSIENSCCQKLKAALAQKNEGKGFNCDKKTVRYYENLFFEKKKYKYKGNEKRYSANKSMRLFIEGELSKLFPPPPAPNSKPF